MKNHRSMPLRRWPAIAGLVLGGVVLAVAALTLIFGNALLNGYGKRKMEGAFAKALPGYALQIGELHYAIGANRLVAQWATVKASNLTIKSGQITLTGARWTRFLWRKPSLADVLARANLEVADLDLESPRLGHGVRCSSLKASVPGSELTAERIELRPLLDDEEFFAANEFRRIRFRAIVPKCRVSGLEFGEWLGKKGYRARAIDLSRPSLDALVNTDKAVKPLKKPPASVTEALAVIRRPLQIDALSVTDGNIIYGERAAPGAAPGVLTVTSVNLAVENIANRGGPSAVILIRGRGAVMNAGLCTMLMTVPVASRDYALHYSGSIGTMDLVRLNAFLEHAKRARIKSGRLREGSFDIEVADGRASGLVRANYDDLKIAVLGKQTGSEKGLGNRAASFTLNAFKIRNSNAPGPSRTVRMGTVAYTRDPQERFLKFTWHALRSGIVDVISR